MTTSCEMAADRLADDARPAADPGGWEPRGLALPIEAAVVPPATPGDPEIIPSVPQPVEPATDPSPLTPPAVDPPVVVPEPPAVPAPSEPPTRVPPPPPPAPPGT